MKGATCKFCGTNFRNRQAVRAHLKGCAAYRQLPQANLPSKGSEPKGTAPGNSSPSTRSTRRPPPEDGPARPLSPGSEAKRPQRDQLAQQEEEAPRQREHERDFARLRIQQEAEARARREAAERELKERRRRIIQRVKDQAVGGWWSADYTIPPEARAQALSEIEKELSGLPPEELPESELVTLAEGIRDRIYQPLIRDQAQQRKLQERRAELIDRGVAYARQELRREPDLPGWARVGIEQKVKQTLEREITGTESEPDVKGSVDEILDEELEAVEERAREKARPKLIAHGATYATRELAQETDLDVWERLRIEQRVKKELEHELTGWESESDVEDLVDDILDEELGEPEDDGEGF